MPLTSTRGCWRGSPSPTACSWLNAVETFFAALTKRRLRRGVFRSIVDLQAAIHRYIAAHNTEPKPFAWTADPDRVLATHQARETSVGVSPLVPEQIGGKSIAVGH